MSGARAHVNPATGEPWKVCHFTSVHKVNDIRVYLKECASLAAAGFDVTLIGIGADAPDRGVKVVKLRGQTNRLKRMISQSHEAYKRALDVRADVYHFHDPELLPYGLLLKRRTGAKVIFDSHECFREDIVAKDWIPKALRPVVGTVVGAVEDFVVGRIDQLVAATPHIAESFEGIAKRVATINNYPLDGEFGQGSAREDAARDAICYVGAISFVRGIIPFLDALSYVDAGVTVHVAGIFANKAVEDAARAHPNWSRVTFHGQVDRQKIAEIYDSAFAGIVTFLPVPNHVYSQPNKLFEYMSAGIPVIGSHFPLWKTIIEDGGCGIVVDPADGHAIGTAIETLRQDPAKCRAMAENGARLIADRYNWTGEGNRLVEVYNELLSH